MRLFGLLCLLACAPVLANDADALSLADQAPITVERASDWKFFVEAAAGESVRRSDGAVNDSQRVSLDLRLDKTLSPGWRLQIADRLDMNWQNQPERQNGINTLKEAYVSWQPEADRIVDLGRINMRNGVALGYNPTDFFRAGAVRSVVSIDPASLKKNRLGSVMTRGQMLWANGSLTALYSPKLEQQRSGEAFSPDFGATNKNNRWLLSLSQRISESINPQWLVYGEEGMPPQIGFNLSALANDSTIVYVEWAGGRSRSQLSQALGSQGNTAFHNLASLGLTHTTANKLSLTLEYEFNSAALDRQQWDTLGKTTPAAYGQYRAWAQDAQELATKKAVLFYATWQDMMINNFDLTLMTRFNVADHSRLSWVEGRYHLDRTDVALQWQVNSGEARTEFGAAPQSKGWQLVTQYFF